MKSCYGMFIYQSYFSLRLLLNKPVSVSIFIQDPFVCKRQSVKTIGNETPLCVITKYLVNLVGQDF